MKMPVLPEFLFAPDAHNDELYILHTRNPKCIIWIHQTIPAQLFIIEDFGVKHNDSEKEYELMFADVLKKAAEFHRNYINSLNTN
ncbi:MAG: hypothetical protein PHS33_07955 [Candidatus Omnitrophica bacterium]|nr:hypothetical protein [Candidatus Omnitrophota bacterium]